MTETRLAPRPPETDGAAPVGNRSRSRKFKAVLAGGLVLGVGAAITLAAWNDSEFATGTFSAGTFNLEGSTTSSTAGFVDNDLDETGGTAAALVFTTPFDNLAPEDVVYAPFWLRLAADTTTDATLVLDTLVTTDSVTDPNAGALSYAVYELATATATCDAAGVAAGTEIASADALTSDAAVDSGTVDLTGGAPVTAAGAPVQLCVVVTAGADLDQGGVTTSTWEFTATSTE
ncbi:SipW-dependent-type signal peptide-containing protein [Labedella endophytica]|uniref:SipW-cognate class signal peptide n=1 Tax=Labedella endophytica TaxID=1523160 RepID=A0A433JTS9_9MICO|nr:SipW-dependent-type signal peptide-containing protein [Labedella endophytica]RUR01447.1 hypothetical protein ELQ94_08090 [Labedella endophytica]